MLKWSRLLALLALLAVTALAATTEVDGEDPAVNGGDTDPPTLPYDCADPSSTGDSFIDYDHLVHCNPLLQNSPVLGKTTLVLCLVLLLYLLSSTADEFFCPVLQAIVEKYRIPPHVAGVTFLSFGNGSPDVFSNIAAFATPTPSIGVTAILGGGLLVTTVITACVGLVSTGQEQLIPRTFLRDVVFYFISVLYLGLVFFDGKVGLLEAVGFLSIYFVYVLVVFSDKYLAMWCFPSKVQVVDSIYAVLDDDDDLEYWSSTASEKSPAGSPIFFPVRIEQPQQQQKRRPYLKSQTIPVYDTFARSHIFSDSEQSEPSPRFLDRMLYRKSSVPTPRSKPHITDDFGPIGRDEGLSLLEVTDVHLKRPSSMYVGSMQESLRRIRRQRRRRKTAWESLETSAQFGASARRWTRGYHALSDIDEIAPALEAGGREVETEVKCETSDEEVKRKEVEAKTQAAEDEQLALEAIMAVSFVDRVKVQAKRWGRLAARMGRCAYSTFERFLWSPFEVLTVFVRRLTIPLVDEDTWDKNLAVVCPPFALLVFGVSVFSFSIEDPVFLMTIVVVGGMFSAIIEYSTSPLAPPEGWLLAPFICLAFVMSVIWIMNIANEVLAVLETLGELFGISSSVLGVSVLAWGNSTGDLVSNMAIARDGFPTMAFAGCFAGPMFNLLIGIGLSLTIAIISRGPLYLGEPTPLVYLGFGYLLLSLLLNIGIASCDGFRYRPRLCYILLTLYASFAIISIAVVLNFPDE
ncbi:Ca2 :Cation Antiporter (CaCA) Family [Phytophthora cinnamomi]|uniref:Ca2:Cation Antiporter (CaCA) Family n=1 Tax=Phytophthora cinnamomi TaxID=4785 RepID=UPI00355997BA|nr:Ca2 :Cation Antiporter (CaCA) Family [Phytophthora cinnamomi]